MARKSRKTRQKDVLAKEISAFKHFFSAEDVLERVKGEGIGIATVYRFLAEQRKEGNLHSFLCEKKTIYSQKEHLHCHFICEQCGTMKHFDLDSVDFLKDKLKEEICHVQVEVHGTCKECQ